MKRSTKVFLGAMGVLAAAGVAEVAFTRKLPPCPVGPDGKPIVTPECRQQTASRSGSSSGFYAGSRRSSGGLLGSSSSSGSSIGTTTSSGGWGSIGRAFSRGG